MFVACLKQRIFEKVIYLFTMSKIESKFQGLYKVKSINVPEPTPTHILRVKEHRMSSKPDAQHIYLQKITESHQYYRFSLCIYIHLWWTMDAFIRAIVIDVELSMQSAASNNNNNRKEVNKFQLFILKVIILNIRFFFLLLFSSLCEKNASEWKKKSNETSSVFYFLSHSAYLQ